MRMIRAFPRQLALAGIAAGVLAVPLPLSAGDSLTHLEQHNKLSEVSDTLNTLRLMVEQRTWRKELLCMKAFGHATFCNCVAHESPVGVNFEQYVTAVTMTKEELKYSMLKKDDQELVDLSRRTRDRCVETSFIEQSESALAARFRAFQQEQAQGGSIRQDVQKNDQTGSLPERGRSGTGAAKRR